MRKLSRRGAWERALHGGVDGLEHFLEDVKTGRARLVHGFGHGFHRQSGDLHVHLQGGDALFAARHFEIHVTEEVLDALDVGEDPHFFTLFDQTHGGSAHRGLQGHTGIHQRQGATADGTHGGGSVGAQHFADHTHHVGEGVLFGQHGEDGALRQGSVADLASTGERIGLVSPTEYGGKL